MLFFAYMLFKFVIKNVTNFYFNYKLYLKYYLSYHFKTNFNNIFKLNLQNNVL